MPRLITLRVLHCLCLYLILCFPTDALGITQNAAFDFDRDNKLDLTVYRPSESKWYIFQSQSQSIRYEIFGVQTDRIVPGDYDGDGKADVAVFRPTDMTWYILRSSDGFQYIQWGINGDLPFTGDFDGDGKTDLVVIRTAPDNLMTWHILRSQLGYTFLTYGEVGDVRSRQVAVHRYISQ